MTQTKPENQRSDYGEQAEPATGGEDRTGSETRQSAPDAVAPTAEAEPQAVESEAVEAPGREAELQAELEETRDRLLRTLAEMENLRRRTQREVEEARKYAISGFARELLDVADNLARALESVPQAARDNIEIIRNLADGVALTHKMLLACFEHHQIEKVAPEPGEKFDHNRHQAMFEVETDQHPPGAVAQIMQPGYTIAERLLRPALVAVAKPLSAQAGAEGEPGAAARERAPEDDNVVDLRSGERLNTTA